MPTRSVKLKFIVPRDNSQKSIWIRRSIWATHEFVNDVCSYYGSFLLELRQRDVCIARDDKRNETIIPAQEYRDRLTKRLSAMGLASDAIEAALPILRELYEDIVPNAVEKGSKGEPNSWLSPLVSASSKAEARPLVTRLRALGVLPLLPSYGRDRMEKVLSDLGVFERMAFNMVVEHMASWEAKCHDAPAEKEARREKMERLRCRIPEDALLAIQAWEQSRRAEIAAQRDADVEDDYRIGPRELRSWADVRERLHGIDGAAARAEVVKEVQRRNRSNFGGATLLSWLARPAQRWLVEHPAGDVVTWISEFNDAEERYEWATAHPIFTMPDARRSPKSTKLGKPGDGNAPAYELTGQDGRLLVTMKLLEPTDGGKVRPTSIALPLAGHRQLAGLTFATKGDDNPRGLKVSWSRQDGTGRVYGELQGASLVLDRDHAAGAHPVALRAGNLSGVWFKLAIDVNPDATALYKERRTASAYLDSALHNRGKKKGVRPPDGFRVMAVDLGQRVAATAAIFTIRHEGGRCWPLDPRCGLSMEHDKTLSLSLPGEDPCDDEAARRSKADAEIRDLRASLWRLRQIARLGQAKDPEARLKVLKDVQEAVLGGMDEPSAKALASLVQLESSIHDDPEAWLLEVRSIYADLETSLGRAVKAWRSTVRSRHADRAALGQLSLWAVEYKTRALKFLRAWNRRQRPGQDRRDAPDGECAALLDHVTNLKTDRAKQAADLIVQSARGFVYRDGVWVKVSAPVDLILFEDLSEYTTSRSRAPSDNAKLMAWTHREVVKNATMQAEVEGIVVSEVGQAFTSRFDALTGAPGVRCHAVTREDVDGMARLGDKHWLVRLLSGRLANLGFDPASVKPGDIVPTDAGKLLVTLSNQNATGLRIVDADVSASRSLAKRYVEGYATPYRANGVQVVTDAGRFVVCAFGENAQRLQGTFGARFVVFTARLSGGVEVWDAQPVQTMRAVQKLIGVSVPLDMTDEEADRVAVSGSARVTLFRDPSGNLFGGRWVDSLTFWSRTRILIAERLKTRNSGS